MDGTEGIRREMVQEINSNIESNDESAERARLEEKYGQVWDTDQVRAEFDVKGFMAPFVIVQRKTDGKKGTLMFQHHPRFYFSYRED